MIKTFKIVKSINEYIIFSDDFNKIIAHTGIPQLEAINTPLFEIPDNNPKILAREAAILNNYDVEDNVFKHGFVLGYREAGNYTRDDIESAIAFGMTLERFKNDEGKLSDTEEFKGFLQSLKKVPVSADIEMEEFAACIGFLRPKVDKNNYLIIKKFNYE